MFDAHLAFQARVRPRALAVLTPRRRATYAEFDADIDRYAVALRERDMGPHRGIVAVELGPAYRRVVVLMALARLGVTTTTPEDTRADLRIAERPAGDDPRIFAVDADWIARVEAAPVVRTPSAPRDPNGVGRVILSSGTTGQFKRVPLSWRRLETGGISALSAYASGKLGVWSVRTGIDSSLGFAMATLAWSMGAAVAVNYDSGDLPYLMEQHPAGLMGVTPMMLRELIRALPQNFELKPDWRIVVTGDLLPAAHAREARARLTPDIHVIYGSTEAGRAMVGPARYLEEHPGAVGFAVPGVTVEVVDADGAPVPDGETGEIRIRSPNSAGRYLDDEEAGATAFRDGWFYPGDLGRRLPSGLFIIDGRRDERMTLRTAKLTPNVLENILLGHPGVRECAAFAVPGPDGFDQCWIAVVPRGEVGRDELLAHLRNGGAPPIEIRFAWAEDIPHNDRGKVDRRALRVQTLAALDKARAELGDGGA